MRLGIALPHFNRLSDAESIGTVARSAEALGFHSLWVSDHIIVPAGSAMARHNLTLGFGLPSRITFYAPRRTHADSEPRHPADWWRTRR